MQIDSSKFEYSYAQIDMKKNENSKFTDFKIEITSFQLSVTNYSFDSFGIQQPKDFENAYKDFQKALDSIGYDGEPIAKLSTDEAAGLISEDGIFGINKTSERISQFVLIGAGDNIDMLRAGRAGVISGYKEVEAMWGKELPEISQKTLEKALQDIDARIVKLGFSVVNLEA